MRASHRHFDSRHRHGAVRRPRRRRRLQHGAGESCCRRRSRRRGDDCDRSRSRRRRTGAAARVGPHRAARHANMARRRTDRRAGVERHRRPGRHCAQAGQILARYHADELRDTRAKYRQAMSDLDARAIGGRVRAAELRPRRDPARRSRRPPCSRWSRRDRMLVNAHAATRRAERRSRRACITCWSTICRFPPTSDSGRRARRRGPDLRAGGRLHPRAQHLGRPRGAYRSRRLRHRRPVAGLDARLGPAGAASGCCTSGSARRVTVPGVGGGPFAGNDRQSRPAARCRHARHAGAHRPEQSGPSRCGRRCWRRRRFQLARRTHNC